MSHSSAQSEVHLCDCYLSIITCAPAMLQAGTVFGSVCLSVCLCIGPHKILKTVYQKLNWCSLVGICPIMNARSGWKLVGRVGFFHFVCFSSVVSSFPGYFLCRVLSCWGFDCFSSVVSSFPGYFLCRVLSCWGFDCWYQAADLSLTLTYCVENVFISCSRLLDLKDNTEMLSSDL